MYSIRRDSTTASRPGPSTPKGTCAHLWRCGTRQRGETSHPGGWKSPRTPSEDDAAISWCGLAGTEQCATSEGAQPRVQVRPGSFLPGLAAALFSAAGDEAAFTRREGGSALSEVCRPGGGRRGISTRRPTQSRLLPTPRRERVHLPDTPSRSRVWTWSSQRR